MKIPSMKMPMRLACYTIALSIPATSQILTVKNDRARGQAQSTVSNTRFMYLTDTSRGTVSLYKVTGRTPTVSFAKIQLPRSTHASVKTPQGRVNYRTAPYPQRPSAIAITPSSRYAYITNQDANEVLQYKICSSGALKPLQPPVVKTGHNPVGLILDGTGRYIYVSTDDGINQYRIGIDGKIRPLVPTTVPGGYWPSASCFAVTADNCYLYCLGQDLGQSLDGVQLYQYLISADGTLSNAKSDGISVGSRPTAVCLSADSHHLYVADFGENLILTYHIEENGRLRQVPNTRLPIPNPTGIAVAPDGRTAYVISTLDNVMFQFRVLPTGLLTAFKPAKVRLGFAPQSVTVDPDGKFVLIGGERQVTYFPISPSGKLGLPSVLLHQPGYPVVAALFK